MPIFFEKTFPFLALSSIFVAVLVIASILANKIVAIGPFFVPAGILAYSITFFCTDLIGEVYGKRLAQQIVLAGFIAMLITLLLIKLAIFWPAAPIYTNEQVFVALLSSSDRIIIASILAYLISQMTDVWLFDTLRRATQGHLLWLRNNVSTIFSQLLDSVIFILIAFYATGLPLLELVMGQWIIKLCIALLDTPFIYIGVHLMKNSQPIDTLVTEKIEARDH
jgi:hypothetical protein